MSGDFNRGIKILAEHEKMWRREERDKALDVYGAKKEKTRLIKRKKR